MTTVERGATLSEDGRYRHVLWRTWDHTTAPLGWIMLNPSTADGEQDDPTIRRCIGFARRLGYGGIRVANLFDLRATDPRVLDDHPDPLGPRPDPFGWLIFVCTDIVAGWGAVRPRLRWRIRDVLDGERWPLHCLGTTKTGDPRHPLYLSADTPLTLWRPTEERP